MEKHYIVKTAQSKTFPTYEEALEQAKKNSSFPTIEYDYPFFGSMRGFEDGCKKTVTYPQQTIYEAKATVQASANPTEVVEL